MPGVLDPSDPASVGAALCAALAGTGGGGQVELVGVPERVTAATSAWVWFVQLAGDVPDELRGRQVLRIFDPHHAEVMRREVALGEHLITSSFPVARTHWHGCLEDSHPALLQQRLPGVPAIELLGTPRVRRVVRALGSLQAELHAIDPGDAPLAHLDGQGFVAGDLARRRAGIAARDRTGTWEWLNDTADRLALHDGEAPVLCHGDFHPLNALVAEDGGISVVDWTDACIADRHHDVGRSIAIFWFASLIAERPIERVGLRMLRDWLGRTHRSGYEQRWASRLSDRRLAWWQVAHLFRGWLQLSELAEGAVPDRESSTTARLPPDLTERILERCLVLRNQASP